RPTPSGTLMLNRIQVLVEAHAERLQVAEFMLKNGLSVRGNRIFVNEIEVPTLKVARAVGVDRRTVNQTIRAMDHDRKIRTVFRSWNQEDHRSGPQPSNWG